MFFNRVNEFNDNLSIFEMERKMVHLKKLLHKICFLIFTLFLLVDFNSANTDEYSISEISRNINAFTLDFLNNLPKEKFQNNLIVSPQSVYHGLAMSYIASDGKTRKELAKAFHFSEDNEQLIEQLTNLRKQFKSDTKHKKIEFNLANSAWLDGTYATFREEYSKKLEKEFGAELYDIKFGERSNASDKINKWISDKTKGRIKGSIGPDDFISRSVSDIIVDEPGLVTVNAIYYKSDWASRFNKSETKYLPFYLSPDISLDVELMHQQSLLLYSEDNDFKFLEVPYISGKYSMYVLLPMKIISAEEILSLMNQDTIFRLKRRSFIHNVDVHFPKYEIESHLVVGDILNEMGVKEAFDNQKANFDKMIHKTITAFRIYLSEIYHDAWIKVNEEGTEAAAATTSVHYSFGCSAPALPPPAVFKADHPFLFLIVHNKSQSILFAGWIINP